MKFYCSSFTVTEYKETFDFFDKDGNGTVSKEELCLALRATGLNPTEGELQDIINRVDSDGRYIKM